MKNNSYVEKLSMDVLEALRQALDATEDALSDLAPGYNSDDAMSDHFAKKIQGMWDDISTLQGEVYAMIGDIQQTIKVKEYIREMYDMSFYLPEENDDVLLGLSEDDLTNLQHVTNHVKYFLNCAEDCRTRNGVNDG